MSWTGENKNAIRQAVAWLDSDGGGSAAVSVVSAYYSAVGTTYMHWREARWRLDLLLWMVWWRRQTLQYALPVTETFLAQIEIGNVEMCPTADDVDVLCTVLYRFMQGKCVLQARLLLRYVEDEVDPRSLSLHTQAFIALHRVRYGLDVWSEDIHDFVFQAASQVAAEAVDTPPKLKIALYGQASRIMRQLAEMVPAEDERQESHHLLATFFADAGRVTDQQLKLRH